jgi:PAS domain S-box-containing protein
MSGVKTQGIVSSRFFLPAWLTGPWGMLGLIAILYTILNLAWTFFHWGGPERLTLLANLLVFFPGLVAVGTAWRAAAEPQLVAPLRRAWFILGLSFLMFLIGNLIWAYLEVVLQIEPFPSIADVFYLAFYPIALWGLLSMPGLRQNRRERFTLWLDLLCILTVAAMFVGYFIIVPTAAVSSPDLLSQLIATAYPLGSLLVLGGVLTVLYRPVSLHTRSALSLLLIGMIFFLGGDFAFGYTSLTGTYAVGGWTDASWNVAQLFFALAALRKLQHGPGSTAPRMWMSGLNRLARWFPPLAVGLGYGLVFYVLIANYSPAAQWLMAGALLLTLLVVARQIVSPGFADLPVRVKVILTCIMVSVLSVSLVAATAYLTIRSNLEAVVGNGLKADVEIRSQTLGNELGKQVDLIEGFVLGETIESAASGASDRYNSNKAAIQAALQWQDLAWKAAGNSDPLVQDLLSNPVSGELYEFLQSFPTYANVLLTDKYGALLAATARPENYYQGAQDWWQAAYNHGQGAIYVGQPTLDHTGNDIRVVIAMPVHADHGTEVVGVIYANYHLHDILEVLTASSQAGRGFAFLLPDGQLITPQGTVQSLDAETVARLQASPETDYAELPFQGALQLVSQAHVTSPDPEDASLFRGLNWTLITYEDPAMAFSPLHAAWRTTLLSTLLVLLLTSGVAVILAQILMAPISRLTQAAAQIATGDLSTKAPVESRDEIGTLAHTFNSMLAGLARAQQEVRESEALYRSLVDYSPDMITVHSEGKVLFINPAGLRLLGASGTDDFVGKPLMDMIPPQDQVMAMEELEYVQMIGQSSPLLQRKMHRLDGTTFDAEFRVIPISYAGRPAMQFVMRDITERKAAEEKIHQLLAEVARHRVDLEHRVAQRTDELNALNLRLQDELTERQRLVQSLQESEERFHLVFETSPDAIFLLDPHDPTGLWRIIDCNDAAGQMNGYTREELIGQPLDILNVKKSTPEDFAASLEQLRQEVMLRGIEAQHQHRDGQIFPIEYSTSLLKLGDREMVLGIDRDITERKQVEEALRHTKEVAEAASRAKSEFLSRMSHELRTPMNAILGFAQLLSMSQKDPLSVVQKERVKQIVKGGEHLLDLINEILDISRIEAGRVQISLEPVSIRASIQEALDLTAPLANQRSIQFQLSLDRDANPYVMADRQRLKQILLNLLSNAVKYNRAGGLVAILCEPAPSDGAARSAWRISVTDTGPGISPEDVPHLFVPFERLAADQSNVEGSGLGLALARRLVELMKGQIGVESVIGQGSTFWIELPAAESQLDSLQRRGGTAKLPAMSDTTRTILYVEDNRANFELVQQVLADSGHIELLWAADPETSLTLAHQHHPDVILLDLHLGGRDGAEVLRQLKASSQTSNIPVVVVSADATAGRAERLMALGAHSYLTKPLDVQLFIQRIEKLLNEQEPEPC